VARIAELSRSARKECGPLEAMRDTVGSDVLMLLQHQVGEHQSTDGAEHHHAAHASCKQHTAHHRHLQPKHSAFPRDFSDPAPAFRGGAVVQRVRHLDLRSVGRRFKSCSRQRCATTLGKLFTPMCLCHQAVYLGTGQRAAMLCGWGGNCRPVGK